MWAPDPRNGIIITGYSIEGTMARDIVQGPDEITSLQGHQIPRRLSVDEYSFAAHVDFSQNSEFIELIKARHIVLVHGEQTNMGRLRAAMQARYKERNEDVKIYTPRNLEELQISFRGERVAKAIGTLASKPLVPNAPLSGLLVAKDFSYTLLDPRDLRDFTGLNTSSVIQKTNVYLGVGLELVKWHLEGMYGAVQEGVDEEGRRVYRVMNVVDVKHSAEEELTLEWSSSASNDMIADSIMAVIVGIDRSPASVKLTTSSHSHSHVHGIHPHTDLEAHSHSRSNGHTKGTEDPTASLHASALRTEKIAKFLEAHFGPVEIVETRGDSEEGDGDDVHMKPTKLLAFDPAILVRLDEWTARVGLVDLVVESDFEPLKSRVEAVLEVAMTTVDSLSTLFVAPSRETQLVSLDSAATKAIMFDSNSRVSINDSGKSEDGGEEKVDTDMVEAFLR